MAVSYLSKTYVSNPYVLPLDLNLMAKVLSYEQGRFDENAYKIQSQIDEFASLDVMKNQDKQYLNNKISNLISNINNLGGVNLADINIANQIQSMGGDIYTDEKVINAVTSTKKVRSLMASYDAYKTDPKLMKYFSEANQYVDSKRVSAWANDGQIGSSYDGPAKATPYTDYNSDFQKVFKDVKARKNVVYTQNGFYLNKITNETYTPEEIMSEARDLLTPSQREQMVRDSQFLYEGKLNYGKQELVAKSLENHQTAIDQNNKILTDFESARKLESNPTKQIELDNEIKRRRDLTKNLESQRLVLAQANSRLYDTNPAELMYQNYSNDYFRGLGRRYSIDNRTEDIKIDPVKQLGYLEEGRNNRAQATINAASALEDKRQAGQMERAWLDLAGKGKAVYNQVTRKWELLGSPNDTSNPNPFGISPNPDTRGENELREAAKQRLEAIPKEENKLFEDYFAKLMVDNPSILKDYTYDFDKDGKVTFKDFLVDDNNRLKLMGNPENPKSPIALVTSALYAFDRLSKGDYIAIDKFPDGTADLVEKMNLYHEEKKFLNGQLSSGKAMGVIPNYAYKLISDDDKTQKSRELGLLKSEIILNENLTARSGTDVDILSIGKDPSGGVDYEVKYNVTMADDKGKVVTSIPRSTKVDAQFARMFGIEEGPYSVLNTTVNGSNWFRTPVQSLKNYKVVGSVVVQQNGNNSKEFVVKYAYKNPKTNSEILLKLPNNPIARSASEAYQIGKAFIQNWSKSKDELEQALLANQN